MAATKYKTGGVTVSIGKSQDVSVPSRVFRGRATCMHFDTDKSFLLPPSVSGVRNIVLFFNRHPGVAMLVNGHTDLVGAADYNLQLSNERANAVAAYLTNKVDDWLNWYQSPIASKRWSYREDQNMLSTVTDGSGAVYYTGPITGNNDTVTQAAASRFQTDNGLKADGQLGPDTRRVLITKYMALEGTSLPDGTPLVLHGCGLYHPIDQTTAADQGNRRVEIFLFDGGIDPQPQDPCPSGGCTQYAEWVGNPEEDIDLCVPQGVPLEFALRAGQVTATRTAAMVVFDSSNNLVTSTRAIDGIDDGDGVRRFQYDPTALPSPATFVWRDELGERRVAGPVDPVALRDALQKDDMDTAYQLLKAGDDQAAQADSSSPPSSSESADEGDSI